MSKSLPEALNLQRLVRIFLHFLAMLGILITARYPTPPERILPIYNADRTLANDVSALITVIGFAAGIALLVFLGQAKGEVLRPIDAPKLLSVTGTALLGAALLACIADVCLTRVSARITTAIGVAEPRQDEDRLARDTLAALHDPATGIRRSYRIATEFLDDENAPAWTVEALRQSTPSPPLQGAIIISYVFAAVAFKLGMFFIAGALYHSSTSRSKPRKTAEPRSRGGVRRKAALVKP
jgi:hypothetical protein